MEDQRYEMDNFPSLRFAFTDGAAVKNNTKANGE